MEMMTLFSSRYVCISSYSTLTSQVPAFSEGQQLTGRREERGRGGEERRGKGRKKGREEREG